MLFIGIDEDFSPRWPLKSPDVDITLHTLSDNKNKKAPVLKGL